MNLANTTRLVRASESLLGMLPPDLGGGQRDRLILNPAIEFISHPMGVSGGKSYTSFLRIGRQQHEAQNIPAQ